MAKILVADDNSNIQKMVGLALKDHGIEVVAVGNGEAAVRKISDIKPDLVLADVFMPVRNGYEVCKYVKEDSTLAHIPVILLVGAFDPLDEQEAQRVGADGVLKKPFVPPDPLISMVKSALVRAGVAHAGFTPVSAQPPAPEPAPVEPKPRVPAVAPQAEFAVPEDESFVEDVSTRPAAVTIDSGSQPLAFGNLLDTSGTETEEAGAPAVTTAPAQERDWRSLEGAEEEGEEEPAGAKASWRRDAGDAEEGANEQAARPDNDWRALATADGPRARTGAEHGWTPTREKEDLSEGGGSHESITMSEMKGTAPAVPFAGDAWAAAIAAGSGSKTAVAEAEKPVEEANEPNCFVSHQAAPVIGEEPAAVHEKERAPEVAAVESVAEAPVVPAEPPSTAGSWFSTPPSPWDAAAQKATQLASTWDAVVAAPVNTEGAPEEVPVIASFEGTSAPDEIEVVSEATAIVAVPAEAVETVREEASQVVEQISQEAESPATALDNVRQIAQEAPALDIDAVVAKVLARLSPEMLQEVTRDILKPVVEAIVREELKSKNS